jgi:hypothetical protein
MKISRQRPGDREVDQECITSSAVGLAEADAFAVNFIRVYLRSSAVGSVFSVSLW